MGIILYKSFDIFFHHSNFIKIQQAGYDGIRMGDVNGFLG